MNIRPSIPFGVALPVLAALALGVSGVHSETKPKEPAAAAEAKPKQPAATAEAKPKQPAAAAEAKSKAKAKAKQPAATTEAKSKPQAAAAEACYLLAEKSNLRQSASRGAYSPLWLARGVKVESRAVDGSFKRGYWRHVVVSEGQEHAGSQGWLRRDWLEYKGRGK